MNGVNAPACGLVEPAWKAGPNASGLEGQGAPPAPEVISNGCDWGVRVAPDHELKELEVV